MFQKSRPRIATRFASYYHSVRQVEAESAVGAAVGCCISPALLVQTCRVLRSSWGPPTCGGSALVQDSYFSFRSHTGPGRKRTNYFCLQGKRGTNEKALLLSHRYSSILGLELKTNINIRLKKTPRHTDVCFH